MSNFIPLTQIPHFDPLAVPIKGWDAHLPPVPEHRLTHASLQQRFAQQPVWQAEVREEPPFTDRQDLDVFPLPELSVEDLAPLLNRPDLGHFLQLGPDDRLRPIPVPGRPGLLEAQHDSGSTVELEGPQNGALRLVVLAQGGPTVLALPPGEFGSGKRVVEVPADLLESMRRLYSAPLYIWIDSRDELGNTIAATPVFELPASPP